MVMLDSNTISYYFRGDPQVVPRLQSLQPSAVGLPAIAAYELRYGLARLPKGKAKSRMEALHQLLLPLQIFPFDDECAQIAARLRAGLESSGHPIGAHDLLIAATALRHQSPLVTRNTREFSRVPQLQVINWHDED